MTKTVPITTRAPKPAEADTWVEEGADTIPARFTPPSGRTKRLTLDIDADSHRALKMHCAKNDRQIAEFIRELISREIDAEDQE